MAYSTLRQAGIRSVRSRNRSAGGPGAEKYCLCGWASRREYHCGTSRGSIERRRVPQVRFLNLGLGVDVAVRGVGDASGAQALLWQGRFAFCYVQLLSVAAAVGDRARAGYFRERAGESARRDEISFDWLCGDAGACAPVNERAEAGDAVDGAAKIEAASGAETEEGPKVDVRGADAIAVCGDGRAAAGVLAGAVLRFQCIQSRETKREVELHACKPCDPATGEASERVGMEQLGVLLWRSSGACDDRCGRMRRGNNPKTQVQKPNLGHPPR